MLRTYNCGVGFMIVTSQKDRSSVMRHINKTYDCYEVGTIVSGDHKVTFDGRLDWTGHTSS